MSQKQDAHNPAMVGTNVPVNVPSHKSTVNAHEQNKTPSSTTVGTNVPVNVPSHKPTANARQQKRDAKTSRHKKISN